MGELEILVHVKVGVENCAEFQFRQDVNLFIEKLLRSPGVGKAIVLHRYCVEVTKGAMFYWHEVIWPINELCKSLASAAPCQDQTSPENE